MEDETKSVESLDLEQIAAKLRELEKKVSNIETNTPNANSGSSADYEARIISLEEKLNLQMRSNKMTVG
jgi:uncharacterized coiled-coil protein SlyX